MESLLVKYGYALLFAGVALEGEAVLLAAGAARPARSLPPAGRDRDRGRGQRVRRPGLLPARPPARAGLARSPLRPAPPLPEADRSRRAARLPAAGPEPLRVRPADRDPRRVRRARDARPRLHARGPAGGRPVGGADGPPRLLRRRCPRAAARGRTSLRRGDRPRARGGRRRLAGAAARAAGRPLAGAARHGSARALPRAGAVRDRPDGRAQPALGDLATRAGGHPGPGALAPARGHAAQPHPDAVRRSRAAAGDAQHLAPQGARLVGGRRRARRCRCSCTWAGPSTSTTRWWRRCCSPTCSCTAGASRRAAIPARCGRRS